MEPSFRFPLAVMRYGSKLFVWTLPHPNPTLNAACAFSKVVVCQTHSMAMLCWRPCSGLLQDGFRGGTVGIMRVCAVPSAGKSADGLFSPRLFFWNPLFTSVLLYGFFFFSCLFNNVKFSLQSSSSQLVLFSFLLQLIEVSGVACRGKKRET